VRKQVTTRAIEAIREIIDSGQIKEGDSLMSQPKLAAQLDVSRASLREAMSTLETLGYLRIEAGRGTFVASKDPSSNAKWRFADSYPDVQVFQSRLYLECSIAAEAACHIGVAGLDDLRDQNAAMARAWKHDDRVEINDADTAFHETIVANCGNQMLQDMYAGVAQILQESQRYPIPVTPKLRAAGSIAEHEHIIQAMHHRDRVRASKAMQVHIVETANALGLKMKTLPWDQQTTPEEAHDHA